MRRKFLSLLDMLCTALAPLIPRRFLFILKQYSPVLPMDYSRPVLMRVDSHAEYSRANSCKKEPGTVKWIERYFKQGDVVYDIGANVGPYTLIAATRLDKKVRIFAFEPHPPTYAKLCTNVLLNNYGSCVTPIAVALGGETGLQPFNYRRLEEGSSGHSVGAPFAHTNEPFEPIGSHTVAVFSIDELVQALSLPIPTHIKIDVDGIEPDILAGAKKTLKNPSVKTVLVELEKTDAQIRSVVLLMEKSGFTLRSVEEKRNHLFVRD